MIRWIFGFLVFSNAAVACEATGQPMGSEIQDAPKVYVSVDDIPMAQPFSILLTVCTDAPIGEVRVDAVMPAHQHGLNYTPRVMPMGDGTFRIDEVLFHMPGLWDLQVDVNIGGQALLYTSALTLK